jgi:hypothetical protein
MLGNTSNCGPHRRVRVRSLIRGMSQRTTVEQTFANLEDRPIEVNQVDEVASNSAHGVASSFSSP